MEHPTTKQRNDENHLFLKGLYFDMIKHFLKKLDLKTAEQLEQSWKEVETEFAEIPPVDKVS